MKKTKCRKKRNNRDCSERRIITKVLTDDVARSTTDTAVGGKVCNILLRKVAELT